MRIAHRLWDLRYLIPLTPLGFAVLLTAGWIHSSFAIEQQDYVLYAAARVILLMLAATVLSVLAASIVLHRHLRSARSVDDLQLESGVRAATRFNLPRFAHWPMVQIKLKWADPRDVQTNLERTGEAVEEVVTPRRRGRARQVRRRFIVSDIFGLARFGVTRATDQRVRIMPGPATTTGKALMHFAGGEALAHATGPRVGELLDIRRYGYGDPLRHVLWKAFARTRQLLVRTAEQAIHPTPSAMAYFIAGPGDEATASIARFFLEHRLLGEDFRFMADGATEPTGDVAAALDQLIDSVQCRSSGALGLRRFVEGERGRQCVLFVPPAPGSWVGHVIGLATHLSGTHVVLAIDDDLRVRRRGVFARLLVRDMAVPTHDLKTLCQLVHKLASCGMNVSLVHRPSGEIIPLAQIEALA